MTDLGFIKCGKGSFKLIFPYSYAQLCHHQNKEGATIRDPVVPHIHWAGRTSSVLGILGTLCSIFCAKERGINQHFCPKEMR